MPLAFSLRGAFRTREARQHATAIRPPLQPRPLAKAPADSAREAGIINFYRNQLLRAHAGLETAWSSFDAHADKRHTSHVRAARSHLNDALNDYYAAAGARSPHSIVHVLAAAEESDWRIAALDHELVAEVRRFELLARDVSEALEGATEEADTACAVADADDALIELEIYRDTTAAALDEHTLARLDHAHAVLRSIVESAQIGPGSRPPSPPDDELSKVPSAPEPRDFPPNPAPSQRRLRTESLAAQTKPPVSLKPVPRAAAENAVPLNVSKIHSSSLGAHKTSSAYGSTRSARQRSSSLRAPSLRSRLRSNPAPPDRDSTVGAELGSRRPRSVLRMRSRNEHYRPPVRTNGDGSPKRRRPSAFLLGFGKQAKSAPATQHADRLSKLADEEVVDTAAGERKSRRDMSGSVRSFLGLVRTQQRTSADKSSTSAGEQAKLEVPEADGNDAETANEAITHEEGKKTSDGMQTASRSGSGSSTSSTESGEELPRGMVMARTRTLRDAAEFARHMAESGENGDVEEEEGKLQITSGASFCATLYQTNNARVEAVSDAGVLLTCSKVVGDGRCLFRSVARGRAVARGETLPKPHAEKKAADKLRARAVAELRKHRGLLLRFYVIEDNFENYIERMALPRTYAGEPELLMLAKVLRMPIAVYLMLNGMYRRIQLYGKHYHGEPIRIRYTNDTHYDALIPTSYAHRSN